MAPRTCIIGAGVSGLVAGKALRDWGVPYTCFDASDEVGGNWYFRNPNGRSSAYRSLHIDTSKQAISFSDFAMDERYPDFPHHTEIHASCASTPTASRYASGSNSRPWSRSTPAREAAAGRSSPMTARARVRRAAGLQRPPWDPSCPDFPGTSTARRCTRTTTSIPASHSTCTASEWWLSGSATAASTSSPSCRARGSPSASCCRRAAAPG